MQIKIEMCISIKTNKIYIAAKFFVFWCVCIHPLQSIFNQTEQEKNPSSKRNRECDQKSNVFGITEPESVDKKWREEKGLKKMKKRIGFLRIFSVTHNDKLIFFFSFSAFFMCWKLFALFLIFISFEAKVLTFNWKRRISSWKSRFCTTCLVFFSTDRYRELKIVHQIIA